MELKRKTSFDVWVENHKHDLYTEQHQTKQLAEFIRVSERTIQRWIKGIGKPKEHHLKLIQEHLDSF